MRLHKREELVTVAAADLDRVIFEWGKRHPELTAAEYIKVVLGTSNDKVQGLLKLEIRQERHGNTDKPGGVE